jgi:hypothetical protein
MIISAFVEVLLPVLVVVVCGYALRRVFPIDLRSLNRVSMYVLIEYNGRFVCRCLPRMRHA